MLNCYFKVEMGLGKRPHSLLVWVGVVSYCPMGHFEDGIASH